MIMLVEWMIFVIFTVFLLVRGQVEQQLLNKLVCIEHEECGACLSAAAHCRWCADPYYSNAQPRCNDDFSLVTAGCSQGMIQRPEPAVWQVISNASLQDMQPDNHDAVVQIQPQRIKLSLKPRETQKIKFTYRPAKNYPLDLYYLMDLTWSMKDDKETLVSLRDDLPNMLKNLTDNFRLGFGSFAEKPVMPFISIDPKRKANPCTVEEEDCEATYSYKHHLSLTNQVSEFISHVNSSSVTANLDNAEAQLDALVQAVTCSRLGWSPRSRKIVILLSDGLMHTAGDGLLGGATKQNDATCHLNEFGYYADAAIYDYPSVAQVYRLLDKYKVNVIFAVTENVKDHYDQMHELLKDFTYVAKLESDSSNILKLVKTGYEDIVSVVDFEDDADKGPVKVKYFTDCGVKGGSMIESTRCSGVEFGMTLNYEAHVSLQSCPEYKKMYQTIKIAESQLGQDSLTLDVEIQCGCDCEKDMPPKMSLTCPVNSHLVCGVCQCNKGWSGPTCDCSTSDEEASAALLSQCREPNVTSLPCSGAGDCVCGRCDCDPGYKGTYCQCKRCPVSLGGMECGGVGRGACVCGACACLAGWAGAACDCPAAAAAAAACTLRAGAAPCEGHGDCVCGKCECSVSPEGSRYSGVYCETCSNCENPMCVSTEPCVACHLNSSCSDLCTIGYVNYTVTERYNDTEIGVNEASCISRREEDGLDCEYRYTYTATTKDMVAMAIVLREKNCYQPTSAKIMPIAFMIMASIILGGIIIILFVKSAQIVSDRRAYAKFVKEAEESKKRTVELNPLYISPISEFRLPDSFPRDKNF